MSSDLLVLRSAAPDRSKPPFKPWHLNLSAVAFGFTVSGSLPKFPDLTFLDILVTGTYCIVALATFENILAHVLREWRDEALAHRIDCLSRWLFTTVYVSYLAVSVIVFLL